MKIGNNDYTPPFWWDYTDEGWFIADSFGSKEPDDGEGDQVEVDDILSALNELAQLRAERDGLKARVEELTEVANYAANVCNAATISTSKSEETAYAIGMLERAICRPYQVNASERNTTPGGDE